MVDRVVRTDREQDDLAWHSLKNVLNFEDSLSSREEVKFGVNYFTAQELFT